MKLRRGTAVAAMVIGAMTAAMGTAGADPAPAPAPEAAQPGIDYSTKLLDKTVVTKLKNGTFEVVEKQGATPDQKQQVVDVKDQAGNVALEMPVDFRIAGVPIPVKPVLKESGTVLELTPDRPANIDLTKPVAAAPVAAVQDTKPGQQAAIQADKPVLKDVASPIEDQRAMTDFGTKFGLATAVGGFIGTAIGAVIGCVVTLPLGCIPGLVTGAGVGGIVGTIAAGGPTLVAAGVELLNTMQAADGTTQWSDAAMAAASGQQQNGQQAAAKQEPANQPK